MKVVTVVGARPQFVKAAVVSRALRSLSSVREILVHTGQHYDASMSDVFFQELEIPHPDFHLGIGSGPHGDQTGRMLGAIEKVLQEVQPDWMLVYGDTNSTLAGALAAVKLQVPVAHVEAGLRSFNRKMPEETNRVLTDHISDLLFTPTDTASRNLEREGIAAARVHQVGDVMYDAALYYAEKAAHHSTVLKRLGLQGIPYILATVHRAENTDHPDRLRVIVLALAEAARETAVVFPVHPRTRQTLERLGLWEIAERRLRPIPPVGYLDMAMLEKHARLIATDSGGVQKEAFWFQVPCVTLRDETEWIELVRAGWNRLVPPCSVEAVVRGIRDSLGTTGERVSLFGEGNAAAAVAKIVAAQTPQGAFALGSPVGTATNPEVQAV